MVYNITLVAEHYRSMCTNKEKMNETKKNKKTFSMRKLVGYRILRQWWCKKQETRVCNSKGKCHSPIFIITDPCFLHFTPPLPSNSISHQFSHRERFLFTCLIIYILIDVVDYKSFATAPVFFWFGYRKF